MWRLIMGSGYSSEEEEQEATQDKNPPTKEAEEDLPDMIATDFGGREQGDGMEKEEEQPTKTFEDQQQHPSKAPLLDNNIQEKEEETIPEPSLCQNELLNSGTGSVPNMESASNIIRKPAGPLNSGTASALSMESANIIRKPAGLLLPEAGGLVISKLPPIHDNVDIRPTPTKPGERLMAAEKAKVYPKGTLPPAVRKQREPKFVPYEPYKGAVAFLDSGSSRKPPLFGRGGGLDRASRGSSVESPASVTSAASLREDRELDEASPLAANYRAMLEVKEKEIEQLRSQAEASDRQLKIQTKVNSEVKKLLVASVGEDIEARVDFLTQDKARLAADVMQYSNRVASEWEARDALGVESDVWKSKYLASSVIVEELEKSRQEASARAEALEHAARRLLGERQGLRQTLASTQQLLQGLTTAFDPLNSGNKEDSGDLLQAATRLESTAAALSTRLVGEKSSSPPPENQLPLVHYCSSDTLAEAELRRLLARPLGRGRVPEGASTVLAKDVRPHLLKLGDQAGAPHRHGEDGFKTCSHCSGTVHVV